MKTKTEIIEGMIDLLDTPEHWCKDLLKEGDAYCLLGALFMSATGDYQYPFDVIAEPNNPVTSIANQMSRMAADRGASGHYLPFGAVAAYNNAHDTTHEDIVLFLKEALYDVQADEARQAIKGNDDAA